MLTLDDIRDWASCLQRRIVSIPHSCRAPGCRFSGHDMWTNWSSCHVCILSDYGDYSTCNFLFLWTWMVNGQTKGCQSVKSTKTQPSYSIWDPWDILVTNYKRCHWLISVDLFKDMIKEGSALLMVYSSTALTPFCSLPLGICDSNPTLPVKTRSNPNGKESIAF